MEFSRLGEFIQYATPDEKQAMLALNEKIIAVKKELIELHKRDTELEADKAVVLETLIQRKEFADRNRIYP
jgi:hypothetical protein